MGEEEEESACPSSRTPRLLQTPQLSVLGPTHGGGGGRGQDARPAPVPCPPEQQGLVWGAG